MNDIATEHRRETLAEWLGLNRATLAVLAVIGCLGLSEEIWSNFLSLHLRDRVAALTPAGAVIEAATLMGFIAFAKNLLEGFGYIIGGSVAHRMGPRLALAVSAAPMAIGFTVMLASGNPWAIAFSALFMTTWEPLSVPAAFQVVGSEVPKNRRTIAFAVQSIQKRLPKVIGPIAGGIIFAAVGYWLNLTLALALVGLAVILQLTLMRRMRPTADPVRAPIAKVLKEMPRDLRLLLSAEIFIRWGDWFARDFAVLYIVNLLTTRWGWAEPAAARNAGYLLGIMGITALATYVPVAKWVDRSPSPRPFIGTTFLMFSLFPICLVLLPKFCAHAGLPVMAGLVLAYVINGLREVGEPARKALIASGFPPEVRARAVGLYWGLRSFAFCPAPIVAALLWRRIGPDYTFLIGGGIGLLGTLWYTISGRFRGGAKLAAALVVIACATMGGCASNSDSAKTLVIYHHGSPTPAIEAAETVFKAKYPDVKVMREKGDALSNMRKVTDLGKYADIVYTDDYSIIPPVMFPKYADFWIMYAHDKMTLAYAANSKYAAEVNPGNWYKILQRPEVKWGIADPNAGPDGYFSLGQIMLSNIYYKNDIFKNLVASNTAITATESCGRYTIDCPENLNPKSPRVVIRPDPETLYPMILSGEIDYAFGYMGSVIGEGPEGIRTLDLPPQVDLSDLSLVSSVYNKVTINLFSDKPDRKISVTLGAKANGLTIPLNARNKKAAADYLEIFLGKVGQDALMRVHITPLAPAETNDLSRAPETLRPLLKQAR